MCFLDPVIRDRHSDVLNTEGASFLEMHQPQKECFGNP